MGKPNTAIEQAWESRVLRDKAYEAHKAYDKAREEHERAMQECRDVPRFDEDSTMDDNQANIEAYKYKRTQDTRQKRNEACEAMAEAYCDYINHKRSIRPLKEEAERG